MLLGGLGIPPLLEVENPERAQELAISMQRTAVRIRVVVFLNWEHALAS